MKNNFKNLSDEELLKALAEGELSALDELYLRYSGKVLNYCLRRGLSKERSEDLLQIVFMQLYRKRDLYNDKHSAMAWMFVITKSELRDYKKREVKDFAEWDDSLSQSTNSAPIYDDKEEVETLLKELKPRDQEAVRLRYLDELEYDEIAAILKESESNVRQIISRSVRMLRGLVKKN